MYTESVLRSQIAMYVKAQKECNLDFDKKIKELYNQLDEVTKK